MTKATRIGLQYDEVRYGKMPFNPSSVTLASTLAFLGEPAVDDGGPRREFFMLFMNSLNSQESLFEGPLDKRVLRHNTRALDKDVYKIVGKIIALSVVNGGPGPIFWADSNINYIFKDGNPIVVTKVEDIPDESIRAKLKKVRLLVSKKCLLFHHRSTEYYIVVTTLNVG